MVLTEEERKAFIEASEPLMKWLADNCHPHCCAIVEYGTSQLVEGVAAHKTGKFLRD